MNVIPVTPDRLPVAAGVLGRAFLDDPMVRWGLGGDHDLDARMTRYFEIINADAVERGWVWETADGNGVAVWLPPAATEAFAEDEAATRPGILPLTDDHGRRYAVFWDWVETHVPDEPMWFLDQIAVEPSRQGSGLGTILLHHCLGMADGAGQPAMLETGNPRNVAYYERFGFRVFAAEEAPDGGPVLWFMRRDP